MGRFERGDDAFGAAEQLEGVECFLVGGAVIVNAAGFLEPAVLRADAGIVEAGADRMGFGDLAVLVLQQIGLVAVENAGAAASEARGMFLVEAMAGRLDAEHPDVRIVEKRMEQADGVGAAADCRDQQVGQAADAVQHLGAGFLADHALEVADQLGIGVGTGGGADDVECVVDIGDPVAQRLVHRVLERRGAAGHRHHIGAEQFHPEDIRLLPFDIGRAHEDGAGQVEARADGGRRHAMLTGTGFGDDAGLAHAQGEQDLADAIVDLVRAGMVELVALEPDLRAFAFWRVLAHVVGQALGIV